MIHLHRRHTSIRELSRRFRVSRKVIRAIVRAHDPARPKHVVPARSPKIPRRSLLDPYRQRIQEILTQYHDARPKRVYEILKGEGYRGGCTIVKDLLRTIRPTPAVTPSERFETAPGVQAQQDWSPYTLSFGEVHAFSYVLGFSRRQYVEMLDGEDLFDLMRGHVRTFEYLRGVAETCLYDNQKAVVTRWELGRPIYNVRFLAFATHYGFRPQALPPRRPNLKGKVERPFFYLETSFFNCRTFRDKPDLDHQLRDWLVNTSDVHPHRTTRRRPIDLFREEEPHLLPLPVHPYDTAEVVYRIVSIDGYVGWDGNEYSVPPAYVTQPLAVKVTETTLTVYSPDIRRLTEHELRPPHLGERFQKSEHKISHANERGSKELDLLATALLELGPGAVDYLAGLKRCQGRVVAHHVGRILDLKRRYSADDISVALEHALRYHAYDCRSIERILAVRAQERTIEEPLSQMFRQELAQWISDHQFEPRSLDTYQRLLESAGRPIKQPDPSEEDPHAEQRDSGGQPEGTQARPDGTDPGPGDRGGAQGGS